MSRRISRRASEVPVRLPVSLAQVEAMIRQGSELLHTLKRAVKDHEDVLSRRERREDEYARFERATASRKAEISARAAECEAEILRRRHEFADERAVVKQVALDRGMTVELLTYLLGWHRRQTLHAKQTARRLKAVGLHIRGVQQSEIATQLGISTRQVRYYLREEKRLVAALRGLDGGAE